MKNSIFHEDLYLTHVPKTDISELSCHCDRVERIYGIFLGSLEAQER